MDAKGYLNQARGMEARLRALMERREKYMMLAAVRGKEQGKAPVEDREKTPGEDRGEARGTARGTGREEDRGGQLERLQAELDIEIEEYAARARRVEQFIRRVEHPVQRELLRYRYLNGWSWQEVAQRMHLSVSRVMALHGAALRTLDNKILTKRAASQ